MLENGNGVLVGVIGYRYVTVWIGLRLVEEDDARRFRVGVRRINRSFPVSSLERVSRVPSVDCGTGESSDWVHRGRLGELAYPVHALVSVGFVVIYLLS